MKTSAVPVHSYFASDSSKLVTPSHFANYFPVQAARASANALALARVDEPRFQVLKRRRKIEWQSSQMMVDGTHGRALVRCVGCGTESQAMARNRRPPKLTLMTDLVLLNSRPSHRCLNYCLGSNSVESANRRSCHGGFPKMVDQGRYPCRLHSKTSTMQKSQLRLRQGVVASPRNPVRG